MNKKIVSWFMLFVMTLALAPSVLADTDTQSPTVPQNLAAVALSTTRIDVSWATSTDNVGVAGYRLFRDNVQIADTGSSTYSDQSLTASTSYAYNVLAYDAAGNVSAKSATATATTLAPDTQSPSVPTNLSATPVSSSQINLTWTASTDNVGVTGYKVYRNSVQVGNVSTTSFSDTGLASSTAYNYTVSAYDAALNISAQSATTTATTLAPDTQSPSAPTNLAATPISTSQINLTWTASNDNVGVTGYKVYRDNVQVGNVTTTSFSDTGRTASTTYAYNVSAYDADGNNSDLSATATATTLAVNPTPTTDVTVKIDVRPGNTQNQINLRSNMLVPVAVFGSSAFDVTTIKKDSVMFAGVKNVSSRTVDVNKDGIKDMIFNFRAKGMALDASSTQATLNGVTTNGSYFSGTDTVKVLNGKKRTKKSGDDLTKQIRDQIAALRKQAQAIRDQIRQKQAQIKALNQKKNQEIRQTIKNRVSAINTINNTTNQQIRSIRDTSRQEIKQIRQETRNELKQIRGNGNGNGGNGKHKKD